MFKLRPALFAFPICVICFLIFLISVFAEESLTITTYYPSPYGVYNELRLYPHSPATTACDSTQEGNTYYDLNAHNLYVCRYNGTTYAWESGGGFWTASGNNIYNTNTGKVGIGTNLPTVKLDVSGDLNVSGTITAGAIQGKRISISKTQKCGEFMYPSNYLICPVSHPRIISCSYTGSLSFCEIVPKNGNSCSCSGCSGSDCVEAVTVTAVCEGNP